MMMMMNHPNKLVEALREKASVEKMMMNQDYMGARDKLTRLKDHFPKLDNLNSMLAVCDILCAASIEFPGCGVDFYWVLQVLPTAKDSDIKSHYHRLFKLLQPIKNKFPSTDLALKLIEDAYSSLSDPRKRSAFDLRRRVCWAACGTLNLQASSANDEEITEERVVVTAQSSTESEMVSTSKTNDGSSSNGKDVTGEVLAKQQIRDVVNNNQSPSENGHQASTHPKSEENNIDMDRPPADSINSPTATCCTSMNAKPFVFPKDLAPKRPQQDFHDFDSNMNNEVFQEGQVWAVHYQANVPRRYAQINSKSNSYLSVTWLKPVPLTLDERRWCEAELPVACGSFDLDPEVSQEEVNGMVIFSQMCCWVHGVTEDQFEIYPKKGEVWAIYKDWDLFDWSSNPETIKECKFEIVEILTDYSKYYGGTVTCLMKVEGFRSIFSRHTSEEDKFTYRIHPENLYCFSHIIPTFRFVGGEMDRAVEGMFELDSLALPAGDDDIDLKFLKKGSSASTNLESDITDHSEHLAVRSYPDNHSLKTNWSKDDFSVGQIWAIYSGTDFMPRRYTLIHDVVSASQVRVTLLDPQPILDCEIQWVKENLPIVCGIFKVGKTVLNLEISWFSHPVKCQQSSNKFFYKIYPRKGDIWAMYKNWSKKWNQSDYNNYQCRFVEILSELSEEEEVRIARLVEVKGCMTFFHRHRYDGFELTGSVAKTEMLGFSHQIPAFKVPGIGRYGILEGSWHLEPDSLPLKHRN